MTDFDEADIHEMRQQKDLASFMRQQIREGLARRTAKPVKVAPLIPGHRPGAWPTGTSPPGPVPQQPPEAWAAATEEHRAWLRAGSPPGQYRCECGCTPPTEDPRSTR
jgi:hypothetical protein